MISNKKKNLLQKTAALALLLAFAQSSISLAYDPYAQNNNQYGYQQQQQYGGNNSSFRGSAQTSQIVDMYSADSASDTSTTQLNASARITNSKARINLSLRDSDVQQVLRMFADKAGLNIVFHESMNSDPSGGFGGSTGGGKKVTLDLVNTNINDAFLLVLEATGLSYYLDNNTVIVAPRADISKISLSRQNLTSLPVHYVDAKTVADFLNSNVFSSNIAGLSNQNIATVNPRTNELMIFGSKSDVEVAKNIIAKLDTKPMINTFKVNHTTPKEMADLICASLVGPDGGAGGSGSGGGGKSNPIDFSATAPKSPFKGLITGAASGDIEEVKLGGGQIACKAESASSVAGSSGGAMGGPSPLTSFSSTPMSVAYFPQLGMISVYGGSVRQVEVIKEFIANNDKKQLMAYLEMSIVELSERGSKEVHNNWTLQAPFMDVSFNGLTGTSSNDVTLFDGAARSSRRILPKVDNTWQLFKDWEPGFWQVDADTGLRTWQAGFWKEDYLLRAPNPLNIKYSVDLAVNNGNGRVLANPKIMITNGKKSVIDLQEDYVKSVKSEFSTQQMGLVSTPIITRTYEIADDAGIKIEMMPFISLDGYVTLNVRPDYATIKERVQAPTTLGGVTSMELVATLLQKRNLELNNLRIKDGETLVIGGMIKEGEVQTISKIPVLGDLPLIGVFFRSSINTKEKSELVIMLTPHIIYDDEQLANVKKENL